MCNVCARLPINKRHPVRAFSVNVRSHGSRDIDAKESETAQTRNAAWYDAAHAFNSKLSRER